MPRIVILYTELADYTIACLKALKQKQAEILLVYWPVKAEAPFQFDLNFIDHVFSRENLSDELLLKKVKSFQPDLILSSGWMDKGYYAVCKALKNKSVTVLSMDNHWTGSIKQQVASFLAPFTLKRAFSKAFVPGQVQKQYALKLGFKESDIKTGFYAADVSKFNLYYQEIQATRNEFPKRFLYLGRYVRHKGIFDLWQAFSTFRKANSDWELWCVGTGDDFENRMEADGIRHFGFIQPDQLLPILKQVGIYILPSHFEPWGVSVQEMAIAGLPLLLSDKIGSKEQYLKHGVNGFEFESISPESLLKRMKMMADLDSEKLNEMSKQSHNLGLRITAENWADQVLSFFNGINV